MRQERCSHILGEIGFARGAVMGLGLLCMLAAAGCVISPSDTNTPTTQPTNPVGKPSSAAVSINIYNDSNYTASVQVDCYLGSTLVLHGEGVLGPASDGQFQSSMLMPSEDMDSAVITAWIDDAGGNRLWSDQKTYLMGTDFGTLSYSIVSPLGNLPPVARIQAPSLVTTGHQVTLDGSLSHDPNGTR